MIGDIWLLSRGFYVVHCSEVETAKEILKWFGSIKHSFYMYPDGHKEMDVIVIEKNLERAKRLAQALAGESASLAQP